MSSMEDMGDLFDHIEDLLDFPCDEDMMGLVDPCSQGGSLLLPPLPASVAGVGDDSLDGFAGQNKKPGTAFSAGGDKPETCDELDLEQLEWMSKFLDDSDSFPFDLPSGVGVGVPVPKSAKCEDSHDQDKTNERCFFRTSSPVSVLEGNTNGGGGVGGGGSSSSSSCFSSSSSSTSASYFIGGRKDARAPVPPLSPPEPPSLVVVPARARSKRPRPTPISPRTHVAAPYSLPPSDVVNATDPVSATAISEPESFGESSVPLPPAKRGKTKKKAHAAAAGDGEEIGSAPPVRKCMHCEIQKTPQWRAGPMGPKTLCNACGVRYKSGRLFPEYRPAASPTFVPSIHSNSHKKVVEMRIKSTKNTTASSAGDNCDLLQYIRRRD